mmetsp:Transcript_21818/g.54359  ORF Transcript_21818/g.54359 Transcript_21818/m.54359 type:complete len:278 (+) Transcript_21818:159-992(+)
MRAENELRQCGALLACAALVWLPAWHRALRARTTQWAQLRLGGASETRLQVGLRAGTAALADSPVRQQAKTFRNKRKTDILRIGTNQCAPGSCWENSACFAFSILKLGGIPHSTCITRGKGGFKNVSEAYCADAGLGARASSSNLLPLRYSSGGDTKKGIPPSICFRELKDECMPAAPEQSCWVKRMVVYAPLLRASAPSARSPSALPEWPLEGSADVLKNRAAELLPLERLRTHSDSDDAGGIVALCMQHVAARAAAAAGATVEIVSAAEAGVLGK